MNTHALPGIALQVRRDIISMSYRAKSAHTGGALSVVEILVALYFSVMRVNPKNADDPKRDRLIFSKAHDAKALYAVLARREFFDPKVLDGYEMDAGTLPGHSTRHVVPGVEASAGSLGHGLPMAVGVALALKMMNDKRLMMKDKRKTMNHSSDIIHHSSIHPRVFAVLSDGECDEGTTWESALFASHHKLDNLTVIIDYNKLQGYGFTKDVLNLEPFADKWKAFGWQAKSIDGHSFAALQKTLSGTPFTKGKPSVVIAHTIKGIGGPKQHIGKVSSQYKPPTEEEYRQLIKD